MLAEIFMMRLEMLLRIASANPSVTASDTRFVPITLPRESKPQGGAK